MVLGEREQEVVLARVIGMEMRILQSDLGVSLFYARDCDVGDLGERSLSENRNYHSSLPTWVPQKAGHRGALAAILEVLVRAVPAPPAVVAGVFAIIFTTVLAATPIFPMRRHRLGKRLEFGKFSRGGRRVCGL